MRFRAAPGVTGGVFYNWSVKMDPVTFQLPTKVLYGPGSIKQLGEQASAGPDATK